MSGTKTSASSSAHLKTVLYATTALISATYGAMFAVLAEYRDKLGVSEAKIGAIVAVGFFTGFAVQIALAPLADRGRAKLMVQLGVVLTLISSLGMAYGKTFAVLFSARVLMGIGAGLAVPALRRIVLLLEPDQVGKNLGTLFAVDVGGFAAGPLVGALTVGSFGIAAPFLIMFVALALTLVSIATIHVVEGSSTVSTERFALDLLRNRAVLSACLLGVAVYFMIGTFDALWVLVMTDLHASDFLAKSGIVVFAVPLVLLGSLGGKLTQRFGPFRAGTFGITLASFFMLFYGWLKSPYAMVGVGVIHGVNDGLTATGVGLGVSHNVPESRQAGAQGLLGGIQTLAGGVAALVSAELYHLTSRAVVFGSCTVSMLLLVASSAYLSTSGGFFNQTQRAD